jgi:hypothetical protein
MQVSVEMITNSEKILWADHMTEKRELNGNQLAAPLSEGMARNNSGASSRLYSSSIKTNT